MLRVLVTASCLVLVPGGARAADTATGSGALALAALVGLQAPLSPADKAALAHMLDGKLPVRARGKIRVVARAVTCRASDVDLSAHDCTLAFGARRTSLSGRAAHELYATLVENGVAGDGAAGSIYEAISDLSCTIDVAEVNSRDGGGATCGFSGEANS